MILKHRSLNTIASYISIEIALIGSGLNPIKFGYIEYINSASLLGVKLMWNWVKENLKDRSLAS